MMAMQSEMQSQGAQYVFVVQPQQMQPQQMQPQQMQYFQMAQQMQPMQMQQMQPQQMQPQQMLQPQMLQQQLLLLQQQQMQQQPQQKSQQLPTLLQQRRRLAAPAQQPQFLKLPANAPMGRYASNCSTDAASGSSTRCNSPSGGFCRQGSFESEAPAHVDGNVVLLSKSAQGCRAVQDALESAATDEAREAIAHELRGSVVEVAKNLNANHVLQKVIVTTSPQSSQFIIDELCALGQGVSKIAKHKYGCRIFQRLLENCRPSQLEELVELIMADWLKLSTHLYGTYVVQCVLEHGTNGQRSRLCSELARFALVLGADIHGSATLSTALNNANAQGKMQLAHALLQEQGLLARMARSRRGYSAVIAAVDAAAELPEGAEAARQLANDQSLRSCRYGKLVVAHLANKQ